MPNTLFFVSKNISTDRLKSVMMNICTATYYFSLQCFVEHFIALPSLATLRRSTNGKALWKRPYFSSILKMTSYFSISWLWLLLFRGPREQSLVRIICINIFILLSFPITIIELKTLLSARQVLNSRVWPVIVTIITIGLILIHRIAALEAFQVQS